MPPQKPDTKAPAAPPAELGAALRAATDETSRGAIAGEWIAKYARFAAR